MSKDDLIVFIKQLLRQDKVSEFDLFGFFEKIISNIRIIEETKLCLN